MEPLRHDGGRNVSLKIAQDRVPHPRGIELDELAARWARNVERIGGGCIVLWWGRGGGEGLEARRRFAFIGLPLATHAKRRGDRVEQASARGGLRRVDLFRDHDVE